MKLRITEKCFTCFHIHNLFRFPINKCYNNICPAKQNLTFKDIKEKANYVYEIFVKQKNYR